MNREIKFRVWDTQNKKMVIPQAFCDSIAYLSWTDIEIGLSIEGHIMQFTGLTDKNGKNVFEGDILKNNFGNYEVEYEAPAFQLRHFDHYGMDGEYPSFEESELVGNIYENKNLLK